MGSGYLGEGGRLRGGPAPELVLAGYADEISHGPRLAAAMSASDIAHAIALIECGALSPSRGAPLLSGLLELDAIPGDEFPWDAGLGDAFNSREAELRRRAGQDAAGWLSAGRPRREAFRVALRLTAREGARALHDALLDGAEALRAQAARHAHAVAADYTYLQPAQPTTVGHLLLGPVHALLRDAARLRACHAWLDLSPAGAGGSAGSRWPLDRARLAELLGFSGVVRHARDAMWQTDGYLDLAATAASAATQQSQLAQDLEILASQEFAAVALADRHSRASALMPQKRNPYALAVVRTAAGTLAGELAAMLTALHTGSARTDHFHLLNGSVPRLLDTAAASATLFAKVAEGLQIDASRLAEAAERGFTAAADVADVLAIEGGIDYRTAHSVVGRAVRDLIEAGAGPGALTPGLLAEAAEALGHDPVAIPDERLREALDPAACAHVRRQSGSSAPGEVDAMLTETEAEIAGARRWSDAAGARSEGGRARLIARAEDLARTAADDGADPA